MAGCTVTLGQGGLIFELERARDETGPGITGRLEVERPDASGVARKTPASKNGARRRR